VSDDGEQGKKKTEGKAIREEGFLTDGQVGSHLLGVEHYSLCRSCCHFLYFP